MKRFLAVACLMFGLTSPTWTQSVEEPPTYPDGQYCSAAGTVDNEMRVVGPDHKCDCHRMEMPTENDPMCDIPDEPHVSREDPKCLQYCHKDHCRCRFTCGMDHGK